MLGAVDLSLLRRRDPGEWKQVAQAIRKGHVGVLVDDRNEDGQSPLLAFLAGTKRDVPDSLGMRDIRAKVGMCLALVEAGCDQKATDDAGVTPVDHGWIEHPLPVQWEAACPFEVRHILSLGCRAGMAWMKERGLDCNSPTRDGRSVGAVAFFHFERVNRSTIPETEKALRLLLAMGKGAGGGDGRTWAAAFGLAARAKVEPTSWRMEVSVSRMRSYRQKLVALDGEGPVALLARIRKLMAKDMRDGKLKGADAVKGLCACAGGLAGLVGRTSGKPHREDMAAAWQVVWETLWDAWVAGQGQPDTIVTIGEAIAGVLVTELVGRHPSIPFPSNPERTWTLLACLVCARPPVGARNGEDGLIGQGAGFSLAKALAGAGVGFCIDPQHGQILLEQLSKQPCFTWCQAQMAEGAMQSAIPRAQALPRARM